MKSGSRLLRRIVAAVLSVALAVPSVLVFPAQSYAAIDKKDTEAVKSIAYNVFGEDVHYYNDNFFRGDSGAYNASLASLSYMVCNMTYGSSRATAEDPIRELREFLSDNGFADVDFNEDYRKEPSLDSSAVACAHKTIVDNGKKYTLLAVIPRSGTFGAEFERSLDLSNSSNDKGDHAGYAACKEKVVDYVREYIKKYGIKGDLKVWTTGYSGGGGVSNLFSAEVIDYPAYVLGNPTFRSSDLYSYNFSPMRVASVYSKPKDSRYDRIHNVYDDADLLMVIVTSDEFDRYGRDYKYRKLASKEEALRLMKIDSDWAYEDYVSESDPDLFMTYKPDVAELMKGNLVMIPDEDSYLPGEMGAYLRGVEDTIIRVCKQAGDGDSRKGFYKAYQKPMMALIGFFFKEGINFKKIRILVNALTTTKTSIPLVLSMYTSFLVNKSMTDQSADLDSLIEESFNRMASEVENEDGSLKEKYSSFTTYRQIRDNYFTANDSGSEGKYRLKSSFDISGRSLLLESLKKLTGALYSASFREALTEAEVDKETIAELTSTENSEATSWFLANLMFGHGAQSKEIRPLKLDNEQFCQMATFQSNMYGFITMHMFYYVIDWTRAADHYYVDYSKGTEAQNTGYRRVFVDLPAGSYAVASVTDGSGKTVATFRDGKLSSRTDQWIGMTAADSGSWLRLPLDRSYRVSVTLSKDATANLKIDDYSVRNGTVERSVTGDKSGSWKGLKANNGETLTLSIPAASAADPTGAVYTLSRKAAAAPANNSVTPSVTTNSTAPPAIYSKAVPAVKNVKTKAGKKKFTVSWKKLPAKQLKKFNCIQLQYSTGRDFSDAITVSLGRTRKSYTVKTLKKGRTYYVRLRNVKTSGAENYVSNWSKTKKVKIK